MSPKKGFYCLSCFEFKTELFKDKNKLLGWLDKNQNSCYGHDKRLKTWLNTMKVHGGVYLYWCAKQTPIRPVTGGLYKQNKITTKFCKFFTTEKSKCQ